MFTQGEAKDLFALFDKERKGVLTRVETIDALAVVHGYQPMEDSIKEETNMASFIALVRQGMEERKGEMMRRTFIALDSKVQGSVEVKRSEFYQNAVCSFELSFPEYQRLLLSNSFRR